MSAQTCNLLRVLTIAGLVGSGAGPALAADPPAGQGPKATICYSTTMSAKTGEQTLIGCQGLGKFATLHEIYERGYRVVNSGYVPELRAGMSAFTQTMYFLIEERK